MASQATAVRCLSEPPGASGARRVSVVSGVAPEYLELHKKVEKLGESASEHDAVLTRLFLLRHS